MRATYPMWTPARDWLARALLRFCAEEGRRDAEELLVKVGGLPLEGADDYAACGMEDIEFLRARAASRDAAAREAGEEQDG